MIYESVISCGEKNNIYRKYIKKAAIGTSFTEYICDRVILYKHYDFTNLINIGNIKLLNSLTFY